MESIGLILWIHSLCGSDAHLLDRHVVDKHGLVIQPDPSVGRAGDGDFHVGIGLHILIDLLGAVGAEPHSFSRLLDINFLYAVRQKAQPLPYKMASSPRRTSAFVTSNMTISMQIRPTWGHRCPLITA